MFHSHQDFMVALGEGFKGARPIAVSVMSSSSGGIRKCWRVSVEKDSGITVDQNQWMDSQQCYRSVQVVESWAVLYTRARCILRLEVCFGHCPSVTARSTSDIRLPTRYSLSKWQTVNGGIKTT